MGREEEELAEELETAEELELEEAELELEEAELEDETLAEEDALSRGSLEETDDSTEAGFSLEKESLPDP